MSRHSLFRDFSAMLHRTRRGRLLSPLLFQVMPAVGEVPMQAGKIIGRLKCLFGRHERSRRLARHEGDIVRSECSHCGVPMERLRRGDWVTRIHDG